MYMLKKGMPAALFALKYNLLVGKNVYFRVFKTTVMICARGKRMPYLRKRVICAEIQD